MGQTMAGCLRKNGEHNAEIQPISLQVTNIRSLEKYAIRSGITTAGQLVQVCGPPMVGKATLVEQIQCEEQNNQTPRNTLKFHPIMCKNVSKFSEVLDLVLRAIHSTDKVQPTVRNVLKEIWAVLKESPSSHHIFVFYKCESLLISGHDLDFLNFIASIINTFSAEHFTVSVIFTTYMKFNISGQNTELVQVDMLTDPLDILSILQNYAPDVDVKDYVQLCADFLGFPEGIIRFAQVFLGKDSRNPSSLCLREITMNDFNFLTSMFRKREEEVRNWICEAEFNLIMRCHPQMSMSFDEEYLKTVYKDLNPTHNYYQWTSCLARLRNNHVIIQSTATQRMTFHPLVIYYCMTFPVLIDNTRLTTTSNWNNQFLWRVLNKGENMAIALEERYRYYGNWLELRPFLENAIHHLQDGSFDAFCKIGIVAARLIMSNFPDEAKLFYKNLLRSAKELGSPGQRAVIEAYRGHLAASGAIIDWKRAEKRLDAAMTVLKQEGLEYFYRWAARRKAIILQRQGHYQASMQFFQEAKNWSQQPKQHVSENLKIPEFLEDEENWTGEIYETISLIYTGKTREALEKLQILENKMSARGKYHPDYCVVLNNIGMAKERGDRDLSGALEWYKKSLEERRLLLKINPRIVVNALNNIAMLLYRDSKRESLCECEKYLKEAFRIQMETNWKHGLTSLTLNHLAIVKLKKQEYFEAFKYNLESYHIIRDRIHDRDMKMKVLLELAHCSVALRLKKWTMERSDHEFSESYLQKSAEGYIQDILDLKRSQRPDRIDSTDFHFHCLIASEHGMLLHVRRSQANYEKYRSEYMQHLREYPHIERLLNGDTTTQSDIIQNHRDFYNYVRETEYDRIESQKLYECVLKSCGYCVRLRRDIKEYIWMEEAGDVECRQCPRVIADIVDPILNDHSSSGTENLAATNMSAHTDASRTDTNQPVKSIDRTVVNSSDADSISQIILSRDEETDVNQTVCNISSVDSSSLKSSSKKGMGKDLDQTVFNISDVGSSMSDSTVDDRCASMSDSSDLSRDQTSQNLYKTVLNGSIAESDSSIAMVAEPSAKATEAVTTDDD